MGKNVYVPKYGRRVKVLDGFLWASRTAIDVQSLYPWITTTYDTYAAVYRQLGSDPRSEHRKKPRNVKNSCFKIFTMSFGHVSILINEQGYRTTLEEECARKDWNALLHAKPRTIALFSVSPEELRNDLEQWGLTEDYSIAERQAAFATRGITSKRHKLRDYEYWTEADQREWDRRCEATDLEAMKIAVSFIDHLGIEDGLFQEFYRGGIYTVDHFRKYLREGTPRRETPEWRKGQERMANPFSELKYLFSR